MQDVESQADNLLALTAEIVSAHVSNNSVGISDLPKLIGEVYNTLAVLGGNGKIEAPVERPQPAVSVKKSITPDFLICLEDGKKLKMLKRHLMTHYQMTPDQYREKWDLPADYPMVAPKYALQRRDLAKKIGLGTGRRRK